MTQFNQWLKVLVTTSMVMGSYSCSESKTVEEYQAEAQKFLEQKDHRSAIIALKNANTIDTKNASLRFELGTAYLSQGSYLSAEKEMDIAQRLGFSEEELLPKLAEIKFKLKKFEEVYQLAEKSSFLDDESYITVLSFAGMSSLFEGDHEQAKQYIDRASEISSASIYGQIGKAYLSRSEADIKQALANIEQLIAYAPDLPDTYLLKGHLLQSSKQYLAAAEAFELYSEIRPQEYQTQFFIAQSYISAYQFEKAEPIVNKLLIIAENHPLANQMKAQIEFERKNYQEAKDYGVKAYQQSDSFPLAIVIAGMSSYFLEDYEQAYINLIKVNDILPINHVVRKVLVELQLRLGYGNKAVNSINQLVNNGEADSSLLTAASLELLKSGNKEAAQDLLIESIKLNSDDPKDIISQGLMKVRLDDLGSGIELLEKAFQLDPKSESAEAALAYGYFNNSQYEKTLEIAKKWQSTEDKKVEGLLLEAEIEEKNNNISQAKEVLKHVISLDSDNLPALYKLAYYAHEENQNKVAFDYYVKLLSIKPAHIQAVINLTRLISNDELLLVKAKEFYQSQLEINSKENYLKLGLAYVYNIEKKYEESISLYEEIEKSSKSIKGIEVALGDTHYRLNNFQEAIKYYRQYWSKNSNNIRIAQRLLKVYEQIGNYNAALDVVESLITSDRQNMNLVLFKIFYQSKLNQVFDKRDINKLKDHELLSKHWLLYKAIGNTYYANKDFLKASQQYSLAYKKLPSSINVIDYTKALSLSDNKKKAIDVLEKYLVGNSNDTAVETMLAGAYLNQNYLNKAMALYENIIIKQPQNIIALNNLAYLKLIKGDVEGAVKLSSLASELAPSSPSVLDTYGQVLIANNQVTKGIEIYNKALLLEKNNTAITINKIKALIINNQVNEAKQLLNNLDNLSENELTEVKQLQNSL